MAEDYKHYNNYSEQDKDSMRTAMSEQSNENENTLIGQTDEVEGLIKSTNNLLGQIITALGTVSTQLDTIIGHVDGLESNTSSINSSVNTKGNEIVAAIQGLPHAE